MNDFADYQVKGFSRYIPTKRAQYLLFGSVPTALSVAVVVYEKTDNPYLAAIIWLSIVCIGLFLLSIELMFVVHQSKHSRIYHHSNVHPYMSFRWLRDNATTKHHAMLLGILLVGILIGAHIKWHSVLTAILLFMNTN